MITKFESCDPLEQRGKVPKTMLGHPRVEAVLGSKSTKRKK